MASNSFGHLFRIHTWGESHGPAIGVVIDGCPAGIPLSLAPIQAALEQRAPGKTPWTSPRKEKDQAELLSGVFEGVTTGAPISILIRNKDADSSKYTPMKDTLRPGHANYTYLEKYGVFDYRGGGRASARETACRVAAGAVAQQVLSELKIDVFAYIRSIGTVKMPLSSADACQVDAIEESPLFCPDPEATRAMIEVIEQAKDAGDSIGGVVEFCIPSLPVGLGDPVYEKLEAKLASAMLSLPASKGFEIGEGFAVTHMKGSEHNDLFDVSGFESNHAGGTLGGISTGMPVYGRVAFKPTSSIKKAQRSRTVQGEACTFSLPEGSRHDPCIPIRAVPVVQAMCRLVLVDCVLLNQVVCVHEPK